MKTFSRAALALLFLLKTGQPLLSQDISGVVNSYAKVTAIDTCTGQLTVSATAGFQPGGAVILIQMQGADLSQPNNSDFGKVLDIRSCGLFEENEIASASPPSTIFLKNKLVNKYDAAAGSVQLVSFPKYAHATIADTLFAKKWDGATGGIVALSAQRLTFHAPIEASGRGFRGAKATSINGNNCSWANPQDEYTYGPNNWRGGLKGEGIASFFSNKEAGRGPQGNGGGGGNDHNSGGGGGSNTQPGGKGGQNEEPATFGCHGNFPGLGGHALPGGGPSRLFMGGGGGEGHGNNSVNGAGGAGGGIAIVVADTIDGQDAIGQGPYVWTNGQDGGDSQGDGAGGGGAGGTVFFQYKVSATWPGVSIIIGGGRGGTNDAANQPRCQGPGGGGAGGQAYCNFGIDQSWPLGINGYTIDGGSAGLVANSTDGCNGSSNGATAGTMGVFTKISAQIPASGTAIGALAIAQQPADLTACVGENGTLTITASGGSFSYQWQLNSGSGWTDISTSNTGFSGANGPVLTLFNVKTAQNNLRFRCKLHPIGGCATGDVFSNEAKLTVLQKPNVAFVFSVNASFTATFTNLTLHATNYLWNFGDGSPTASTMHTAHTYLMEGTYTVSLTGWNACDTVVFTQTVVVAAPPLAGFLVENPVLGCGDEVEVQFEDASSGNITGRSWQFPGGSPMASNLPAPVVTYSSSGSYTAKLTVTGASGLTATTSQAFAVELSNFPAAKFSATPTGGNWVQFTNQSVGGSTYFWDFGDTQTSTENSPSHVYPWGGTWVVTLVATNPCGASVLQKLVTLAFSKTEDLGEKWGLKTFPNPTDGPVFVEMKEASEARFSLQLVDLQGVVLLEKEAGGGSASLDLTGLPAGAYFLKIQGSDGQVARRLVKI